MEFTINGKKFLIDLKTLSQWPEFQVEVAVKKERLRIQRIKIAQIIVESKHLVDEMIGKTKTELIGIIKELSEPTISMDRVGMKGVKAPFKTL